MKQSRQNEIFRMWTYEGITFKLYDIIRVERAV